MSTLQMLTGVNLLLQITTVLQQHLKKERRTSVHKSPCAEKCWLGQDTRLTYRRLANQGESLVLMSMPMTY